MSFLRVRDLVKTFPIRGGLLGRTLRRVHAVSGVSFSVERGETLGVVGESGCGKSTLGKTITQLIPATSGSVEFDGTEITGKSRAALLPFRRRIQMVFQDPYASLNPKRTVEGMLREVVDFHRVVPAPEREAWISELVASVGLSPDARPRYPHEFSGGQRQRIGIARALAVRPEFLVADEPVSALDVSIQAQVLNLLADLREALGLTILFISHDLKVVEHFCDRVVVMYLGRIVESLACSELHARAVHPYTRALLAANPPNDPDDRRELEVLEGDVPSPYDPPPGCAFAARCPLVEDRCRRDRPSLVEHGDGHRVACWAVSEPPAAATGSAKA